MKFTYLALIVMALVISVTSDSFAKKPKPYKISSTCEVVEIGSNGLFNTK